MDLNLVSSEIVDWKWLEEKYLFLSRIGIGISSLLFALFIVMEVNVLGKKSKKKKKAMKRMQAHSQLIAGVHMPHNLQLFLEDLAASGYTKLVVQVDNRNSFPTKILYAVPSAKIYRIPLWILIDKYNISFSVKASDSDADYVKVQGVGLIPGEYDLTTLPPPVPILLTG